MAIGYICSAGIEEKQMAFALGYLYIYICWFAFSYPQWVVFQHGNVLYWRYPTCSTYYIDFLYVPNAGQHSFADYLISALGRGVPRLLNSVTLNCSNKHMSKHVKTKTIHCVCPTLRHCTLVWPWRIPDISSKATSCAELQRAAMAAVEEAKVLLTKILLVSYN